ncbi:vesicle-associated membrane protein-associated protein A-like [Zophobas morio]|uniref:vesicle-associated membrane protein-associated protein A-like n=1 Tax=Zophobas morio TaxID=2755281 RepID=UPI0030830F87
MSDLPQDHPILLIEPSSELLFDLEKEPYTVLLKLTNTRLSPAKYKIMVTSPKSYTVKPNVGCIPPEQNAEIAITYIRNVDEAMASKDKFLVLSIVSASEEPAEEIFKNAPKSTISEVKLQCQFKIDGRIYPRGSFTQKTSQNVTNLDVDDSEKEADMDKLANENLNLKNKYFEMLKKFKEYKHLQGDGSGSSQPRSGRTIIRPSLPNELFIVVFILGWFIGHFLV